MRILLDSHVLLWLLYEPERIGKSALEALNSASKLYVSSISFWELSIKHKKGKLKYNPSDLNEGITVVGCSELALTNKHAVGFLNVELPHTDPFDTILIAQAETEGMILMTADKVLLDSSYKTLNVLE